MKILVITGSPRKKGNSNILADNFIKGAEENGHEVVRFDSAFKKVHSCVACNTCGMNGDCVFKDDFYSIREDIVNSDLIVFATPIYYFGISAQIKSVIDRFYSLDGKIHKPKKTALIVTYADTSRAVYESIEKQYQAILNYHGWTSVGELIASGLWAEEQVNQTNYIQLAYDLGKSI